MKYQVCPKCGDMAILEYIPVNRMWCVCCASPKCMHTGDVPSPEVAIAIWDALCEREVKGKERTTEFSKCLDCVYLDRLPSENPCHGCRWCYPDKFEEAKKPRLVSAENIRSANQLQI